MAFPVNHRYFVRENGSGIVHVAMTFDNGWTAPTADHMTWCGVHVNERDWTLEEKESPNCLSCAAETFDYNWGLK